MTHFTIANESAIIRGKVCRDFFSRFLGLMFRPSLETDKGILIDQGTVSRVNSAIHMFFMMFDIAAIWLDEDFQIVDKIHAKKWHPFYMPKQPARYVLETHLEKLAFFEIGDYVEIKYEN